MSRSTLQTILLAILAAAASFIAVSELATRGAPKFFSQLKPVKDWEAMADSSTVLLEGDGSNTVIVFSDFQCLYCARVPSVLQDLTDRHPGRVTVLFRHLPLPQHRHAMTAAMAAECASDQGAFREFHDLLFNKQDSIGVIPWDTLAGAAGVANLRGFSECLNTERYRDRVERDFGLALELNIQITPSFIVNGRRFQGVQSLGEFERLFR